MRLIDKPHARPQHCAAIPFIGPSNEGVRWIDTGAEMPGFDNHVYLSSAAVEQGARLLGWFSPEEHHALQRQAAELAQRVAELEDQLTEASRTLEAIDVIESKDFRARKKAGRPRKAPEPAPAEPASPEPVPTEPAEAA